MFIDLTMLPFRLAYWFAKNLLSVPYVSAIHCARSWKKWECIDEVKFLEFKVSEVGETDVNK